jgi:integral membrane protein (TIGR01906 family)
MNKPRLLRISMLAASFLFIICIPFLLLTCNLRWAVNDLRLYQYGFDKYYISQETGFSNEELVDTAKGLIKYFNSGNIDSTLSIFNTREMAHLRDVRDLIQLCYVIQYATLGFIILFLVAGFARKRRQFLPAMYKLFVYGSIVSIVALALIGIAALIDFDGVFMAFHRLFFTGDTFILNGYLPTIFTEGFFSDAARFTAIAIIIEAIIIGAITGGLLLRSRRRPTT